jgi:hypothetical protein
MSVVYMPVHRFYTTESGCGRLVTRPETEKSGQRLLIGTITYPITVTSAILRSLNPDIRIRKFPEHVAQQINNNLYFSTLLSETSLHIISILPCWPEHKATPYFSNEKIGVSNTKLNMSCCSEGYSS